jgi:hypothetical protein
MEAISPASRRSPPCRIEHIYEISGLPCPAVPCRAAAETERQRAATVELRFDMYGCSVVAWNRCDGRPYIDLENGPDLKANMRVFRCSGLTGELVGFLPHRYRCSAPLRLSCYNADHRIWYPCANKAAGGAGRKPLDLDPLLRVLPGRLS